MILSQNYWAVLTSREGPAIVKPAIVKPAIVATAERPVADFVEDARGPIPEGQFRTFDYRAPAIVAAQRPFDQPPADSVEGCETCGGDTVDLPAAAPIAELPAAPATPAPASPASPTADAGPAAPQSSARAVWIGLGVLVLVGGLLIVAAAARPRR